MLSHKVLKDVHTNREERGIVAAVAQRTVRRETAAGERAASLRAAVTETKQQCNLSHQVLKDVHTNER